MSIRFSLSCAASVALTLALTACGGGGGGGSVDTVPGAPVGPTAITGPNSFLLFPNPQRLDDGTFETNSNAYAQAYYAAIDPTNAKDTLAKWKAANGFGGAAGALGEVNAVFGDMRDLGYGRRMTMRQNPDGTIAAFVENYLVTAGAGYTYSPLNLDAAVVAVQSGNPNGTSGSNQWHVGTNAIEFSPGPGGVINFVKFYTFDPVTGARQLTANLDGRGAKAMPGICINCHGGRADPLTPTGLFPLVGNSVSQKRGDVLARMQMFNVDILDFSATAGYTRAVQEATLKTMNKMVLCTYPLVGGVAGPEDNCRTAAAAYEWQGTAADMLKSAYGGTGMPNATFVDGYVPTNWLTAGQTNLYRNAVHPACATCHRVRGTANQSDIDFMTYAKFQGYADRIKYHVYDKGNMPLAKIVSEHFWSSTGPEALATWLEGLGLGYSLHSGGAVLRPGRPIADPGPSRVVRQGATTLSGVNSPFATTYSWSITTNPGNAANLTNPTSSTPTFNATADGTYVVRLIVTDGTTTSSPVTQTIVVQNALAIAPTAIRFSDIKAVLQGAGCTACHTTAAVNPRPPIFYTDYDRNGDTLTDATDDTWFYKELRGRINFTDVVASPLLGKPANNHHNGGAQPGFDTSLAPGDPGRVNYDLFLNWILSGAPQ